MDFDDLLALSSSPISSLYNKTQIKQLQPLFNCLCLHSSRSFIFNPPKILIGLGHLRGGVLISQEMSPTDCTAEVTSLSPNATEKDVHDFFAFCGAIEHVEIVRAGEYACTAYVTFKNSHALETAVLLSGATIVDRPVCITRWGHYEDDYDIWSRPSWRIEDESSTSVPRAVPSAGEAVSLAQDVVRTMVSKGYVLGKDALGKAKAFDESHQVSATAVAKVAELSDRFGLTDKIFAGVEAARSVDQRYHIMDTTKSAVSATASTAVTAANAVLNSSYFSRGALWASGALSRASQAAADLGGRRVNN